MKLVTKRCTGCTTCPSEPSPLSTAAMYRCAAFISPVEFTKETTHPHITMERIEEAMRQMQLPQELLPYQRKMMEQAWIRQVAAQADPNDRYIKPSMATAHSHPFPPEQEYENRSFIGPEVTDLVRRACKGDQRMDFFWTQLTGRVRTGLNDTIVRGIFEVLIHMLQIWDEDNKTRDTRNLNNIRSLGEAARDALDAFESAKDRESVLYMVDTMEELDAALYDLTQKDT